MDWAAALAIVGRTQAEINLYLSFKSSLLTLVNSSHTGPSKLQTLKINQRKMSVTH